MSYPSALRRDQLARFIPDNETILRFQQLFQVVGGTGETSPGMSALDVLKEELEFYIMTRGVD
jgi:hypothetical protein